MYSEEGDASLHRSTFEGLVGLLNYVGLPAGGFHLALDVGGGYGSAAPFLQRICQKVFVSDIINYNGFERGGLLRLLIEKYERVGIPFDPTRVEFHNGDAQNLLYRDNVFDFIYSVNAFEHIPQPELAWKEIARVAMPGAVIAVQFDPIWTSAYGHHLFDLNLDPWDHLILDQTEFEAKIVRNGGGEAEVGIFRAEMNRKDFRYHFDILASVGRLYCDSFYSDYWDRDATSLELTSHPNFALAQEKGFAGADLLVRGFNFVGRVR